MKCILALRILRHIIQGNLFNKTNTMHALVWNTFVRQAIQPLLHGGYQKGVLTSRTLHMEIETHVHYCWLLGF